MSAKAKAPILAALLLFGLPAPWASAAQSASSTGAQAAESGETAMPPNYGSTSATTKAQRKRGGKGASPQMDVSGGRTPTGPYTSTVQPDTSDLSGSTGASITLPQGSPPPGVAPPNGSAPDTGGGSAVNDAPNGQGGPHGG